MEEQGSSSSSSPSSSSSSDALSPPLLPPTSSSSSSSSSSHPLSSPLSSSNLSSSNVSMKMLVKSLLDILENQEVSLFSISSDDVTPTVRSHLQAAKTSNMRAKDLVMSLLSNPDPPLDASYGDTVISGNSRVVSLPYPSSSPPPPNPHRYSLDASTLLIPNVDSYSSSPSHPTISPAIRPSPSLSSSSSSPSRRSVPPPTTPPRQLSSLSLSSSAIPYHSPSSISLPPSPSSTPSSPSFASSAANEGILPKKSKKNFLRRYTESKLSRSAEITSKPSRRRFTLFQSDNTKLSPSPSSPVPAAPTQRPPSPPNAAMRKTLSLPVASAIASGSASTSASTSPPQSPNAKTGDAQPPAFIAASPSKKGERSAYPLMHEQSKLLFARKLESLRGTQGDVY